MGLSKKDQRNRDHKAATANGTKVETTAGGTLRFIEQFYSCLGVQVPLLSTSGTVLTCALTSAARCTEEGTSTDDGLHSVQGTAERYASHS